MKAHGGVEVRLHSYLISILHGYGGTRWRSWLRHCYTSRMVAGSIPDGPIAIFHWHNLSGHIMAMGLTQLRTEMSTKNNSWGKGGRCVADNLTIFMCRMSWNPGASTSWNPMGLSRSVMGLLYLYLYYMDVSGLILHPKPIQSNWLTSRNGFYCYGKISGSFWTVCEADPVSLAGTKILLFFTGKVYNSYRISPNKSGPLCIPSGYLEKLTPKIFAQVHVCEFGRDLHYTAANITTFTGVLNKREYLYSMPYWSLFASKWSVPDMLRGMTQSLACRTKHSSLCGYFWNKTGLMFGLVSIYY
jgi:hypothetical protein